MREVLEGKIRQTNVSLPFEDYELMKTMMFSERELNRSAFIRRLIRQEWDRRQKEAAQAGETNGQRL